MTSENAPTMPIRSPAVASCMRVFTTSSGYITSTSQRPTPCERTSADGMRTGHGTSNDVLVHGQAVRGTGFSDARATLRHLRLRGEADKDCGTLAAHDKNC